MTPSGPASVALPELAAEMEALEARLQDPGPDPQPTLRELLRAMFGIGGKRVRPALVFGACRAGQADPEAATSLAAAVETLHAATLVHDDLVDGATTRRGRPTLNATWSHGATVLAGDWLFSRAARFAAATGSIGIMDVFARTLQTLTSGELRQLMGRRTVPSVAQYEARIYAKTAALFEASTEMAGILTNRPPDSIRGLALFGRELGMAFQIVDDILDFTGEAERMGKPVGSDLKTGTVTLPAILHIGATAPALPAGRLGPEEAAALGAAVAADSAAIEESWAEAHRRLDLALEALAGAVPGEAQSLLARVARRAVDREA